MTNIHVITFELLHGGGFYVAINVYEEYAVTNFMVEFKTGAAHYTVITTQKTERYIVSFYDT